MSFGLLQHLAPPQHKHHHHRGCSCHQCKPPKECCEPKECKPKSCCDS